ncbi:spectrin beta chain, non-erythrocytic 4-like, partial [Myiozetetes cayanensis]|uniref:spectrin beta chain, non-erythrocytic 4-like n=1 Tax=Myiozetetes cayanensis TaxID=478635 RepID=UPI00215E914B
PDSPAASPRVPKLSRPTPVRIDPAQDSPAASPQVPKLSWTGPPPGSTPGLGPPQTPAATPPQRLGGSEPRRSCSALAQGRGGSAALPLPAAPTHTVTHEGFLLRKHEAGRAQKASNRSWVNLYCVLAKGDLGFYKDAKGHAAGATHGGEPLLSLHGATSHVASDYKKKKNVFKLKTSDGSEFLLQAKDEDEMQGWLQALSSSVEEHAELARWSQGPLPTSSTDEGLPRRDLEGLPRRDPERRHSGPARRK